MLPTLNGRIQTRIFALVVFGGIWTAILAPFLALPGGVGEHYRAAYTLLLSVIVLGIGWEFVYHFIQQFRWEKDWPTLFGFITLVNEGLLLWFLLEAGVVPGLPDGVPIGVYLLQFLTTWVIVWLMVNGPMRVPFIHWRFRGGRLI